MRRRSRPIRSGPFTILGLAITQYEYAVSLPGVSSFRTRYFTRRARRRVAAGLGPVLFSAFRLHACTVAAFVRARFRTAQLGRYFAIVDTLSVARLAAEPLLGGADRLHVARFAVRTQCHIGCGQCHQQDERPRHEMGPST